MVFITINERPTWIEAASFNEAAALILKGSRNLGLDQLADVLRAATRDELHWSLVVPAEDGEPEMRLIALNPEVN